ncbi:uncharacterized protein VB005_08148 [Metarhizium brunneum]
MRTLENPESYALVWIAALRMGLLVGIRGEVARPSHGEDIRVGDVAVSQPGMGIEILVQYDLGAIHPDQRWAQKTVLNRLPLVLLHALAALQPFQQMTRGSAHDSIVIVVDAWDECADDRDVKRLIELFQLVTTMQSVSVKTFVTGRPKLPLRLGFKAIEGSYEEVVLHALPETVIENNVAAFLDPEFKRIQSDFDNSVSHGRQLLSDWPPYQDGHSALSKLDVIYKLVLGQQITGLCRREKDEVIQEFRAIIGPIVILAISISVPSLSVMFDVDKKPI